jgi:hypothetical protein
VKEGRKEGRKVGRKEDENMEGRQVEEGRWR